MLCDLGAGVFVSLNDFFFVFVFWSLGGSVGLKQYTCGLISLFLAVMKLVNHKLMHLLTKVQKNKITIKN